MIRLWRYFEVLAGLVWHSGWVCLVNRRARAMEFEDGIVGYERRVSFPRRYI
jgi:hypothetical protein